MDAPAASPTTDPAEYSLSLESTVAAPRTARQFVMDLTPAPVRDTAGLITSELVTNAVIHGFSEGPIDLVLKLQPRRVRIEVHQPGEEPKPVQRANPVTDGFGLKIVDSIATSWGVQPGAIWAEISVHPGEPKVMFHS